MIATSLLRRDPYRSETDVLVRYLIEPKGEADIEETIEDFIREFKGDAWTDIPAEILKDVQDAEGRVHDLSINEYSRFATMVAAYPARNFDPELGGVTQLLALVAGDNISAKNIGSIRVVDIFLPESLLAGFPGPSFGVAGLRRLTGIEKRPLLHVILKPRLGLNAEACATLAARAAEAGADGVRDDQMLISTTYSNFYERIEAVARALDAVAQRTGKKVTYYPNLTLSPRELPKAVDRVRQLGIGAATINVAHGGLGALELLRSLAPDLVLQAHRSGYVILSNNRSYSISYAVLARLMNLAGADEAHVGSVFGRFDVKKQETLDSLRNLLDPGAGRAATMPIVSGNVTPGLVEANVDSIGTDCIFLAGSGVIGHPGGVEAGVRALRDMIDIVMDGTGIETLLARKAVGEDLLRALNTWGHKRNGIDSDQKVVELVRQNLAARDVWDPERRDRALDLVRHWKTRLDDEELAAVEDAIGVSGKILAGAIGQICEKYVRKWCIAAGIPYHQLYSALLEFEKASLVNRACLDGLHEIRKYYNQSKHKDVFVFFREAAPLVEKLCGFLEAFESSVK